MNKKKCTLSLLASLSMAATMALPAFAEQVYVGQKTFFYDTTSSTKASGSIAPQTVNVVGKEGWYKIETDIGDKWIRIPFQSFTIKIYEKIPYYNQFKGTKAVGSLAAPQNLMVIDEKDGWYKIRTYNGDKWIKAPFRPKSHTIAEKTNIYYKPNVPNALPAAMLNAGSQVTIIGYKDGWYKIVTNDNKFFWMKRPVQPQAQDDIYNGVFQLDNELYRGTLKKIN